VISGTSVTSDKTNYCGKRHNKILLIEKGNDFTERLLNMQSESMKKDLLNLW